MCLSVQKKLPMGVTLALPLLLCGCMSMPPYVRPTIDVPLSYREQEGWQPAQAVDTKSPDMQPSHTQTGMAWWERFEDPLLNTLVEKVGLYNQTLAQSVARYRQAQALVVSAQAGLTPTAAATLSSTRSGGQRRASQNTTGSLASTNQTGVSTADTLNLSASWELDLWGRLRAGVESRQAIQEASAADLEAAKLLAQTDVVQAYFSLRAIDAQKQLLDRTMHDYARSVQLTQNQYDAGIVAKASLILAQTQLRSTEAQALDLNLRRAEFEHAIALLIGKAPAALSIDVAPLTTNLPTLPTLPALLPSQLLERRPDIAAAERRVAAANADIGVSKSAYFPRLSLSASAGSQSDTLANLLSLPNRFWSLGPALAATIFDGGLRGAEVAQARAAYDGTVAAYRQTVLNGFREVEDNLAAQRILEQEAKVQEDAVQLSRRSVELANNQYRAGIVSYLNVIQVQTTALNNERAALDILSRRLSAYVSLVKALGGGWR